MAHFKKNPRCGSRVVVLLQGILSNLSGTLNSVTIQRNNIIKLKKEKTKKRLSVT